MSNTTTRPIIAITAGDINGVGYEVTLKVLADEHIREICIPVIYGNLQVAKKHLQLLGEELHNLPFASIDHVAQAQPGKINIISCYPDDVQLNIGESTPIAGRAALASLGRAVKDMKEGLTEALVTAPFNKENVQSDVFKYSGHTEYLAHTFGAQKSLMMMVSEHMRVALVCNHVPIVNVPQYITEENILDKLRLLDSTLRADFCIRKPRIAVLALNPHSGDNGLIGTEERDIIRPALLEAKEEGLLVFGPYAADGFFGAGMYRQFDAIMGMYHDQALIPFKSLDMAGVNFTAGLPIIRTSPDHGTAYNIAGKNEADPASMRNALYLALDLIRIRKENQELNANKMQEP